MKKLLAISLALVLGASMSFAQTKAAAVAKAPVKKEMVKCDKEKAHKCEKAEAQKCEKAAGFKKIEN